jgi:hypothetical protein
LPVSSSRVPVLRRLLLLAEIGGSLVAVTLISSFALTCHLCLCLSQQTLLFDNVLLGHGVPSRVAFRRISNRRTLVLALLGLRMPEFPLFARDVLL